MKIVSGYLLFLGLIIGALTLSMFWQFNSFQQNLSRLSFSIPASTQLPSLDINSELKKITEQAANQTYPATKEFATSDKALAFSYSPLWQETTSAPLAADQGKLLFSASRINIAQLSLSYLIVRELAATNKDDVISQLKNEAGAQTKITITDNGQQNVKAGTIEVLDAAYDLGMPGQPGSSLNAKIALVILSDKSYVISVYGSQNIWESVKTEANALFSSIQITPPITQ